MAARPLEGNESIPLGDGYELDLRPRRLRRGSRVLKLERIPLEILLLLIEHSGEIVSRDQIASRIWGESVFLDTDNSIRGAIRKLRQALKDDAETPRFIQTVTGQGYRFIAPLTGLRNPSAETVPEKGSSAIISNNRNLVSELDDWLHARRLRLVEEVPDHAGANRTPGETGVVQEKKTWILRWRLGLLALVCMVLTLASVQVWRRLANPTTSSSRRIVLAVLPFDNLSGDPDQEFFSDGLTEEMIAQMSKLNRNRLAVVARSSVARFKGSKLGTKEIARELNADYLLQGSVRRRSDRVRITVQLIAAQNQTDLWTETFDRELKDVLDVQDSVVRSIASQIHIALAVGPKAGPATSRRIQPEAYVAYLKGRYYWNKRTAASIEKAEKYFEDAIQIDPTYDAAYSGAADCNSGLTWHGFRAPADTLPKAYSAARKAIEINPKSAEAHASLGLVLSHRWNWAEAETEFRRALELDPQYANAHHWYGDYLSMHSRHEEALSEARRAQELDPLNLMISTWVGFRLYLAHDYAAAIGQNRDTVEMDPNFAPAHLLLGEDYVQAGIYDAGVNETKRAAALSGDSPLYTAQVAVALAAAGRKQEAIQIAGALQATSRERYVSPYGLAQIYAVVQNEDETFKWLQAAYEDRAVWMGYLAVDPVFERYRSDKRFQELVRRVGVPVEPNAQRDNAADAARLPGE